MPNPSVKDEKQYRALRRQGESKEKAAPIANAGARSSRSEVARKGGESPSYDQWTKGQLLDRARDLDVRGRASMSKSDLIDALRNH